MRIDQPDADVAGAGNPARVFGFVAYLDRAAPDPPVNKLPIAICTTDLPLLLDHSRVRARLNGRAM
jgi:hypothetical protein